MCVALVALDAIVLTQGPRRPQDPNRRVSCFVRRRSGRETVLTPGELITGVELPNTAFFARSHYLKARDRASFEFALASAAVALDIENGTIRAARVALGGVATKPWRSIEAEKALVGAPAGQATFAAAARAALQGARPQKHNGFKIELARRVLVQALLAVQAR